MLLPCLAAAFPMQQHAPGSSCRQPCALWLCPMPQPPLCPGLLLLVWVGCSRRPPMFWVALGLFPGRWTESCGSLEEQGLRARRFSSQPPVCKLRLRGHLHGAAAADGASERADVETATCLGFSTFPQPTATSLVITCVSLGLV